MKNNLVALSIFLILGIILSACSKKEPAKVKSEVEVEVPEGFSADGIDAETTKMMLDKGDHIDIIFHKLPLSMNQDGKNSIFQEMGYISKVPMSGIPIGCMPMARKIFLGDGEILIESDVYFSDDCLFQVFIKDEKPLFANELSQQGINFYKNLMDQAKQSMPQDVRSVYTNPQEKK